MLSYQEKNSISAGLIAETISEQLNLSKLQIMIIMVSHLKSFKKLEPSLEIEANWTYKQPNSQRSERNVKIK